MQIPPTIPELNARIELILEEAKNGSVYITQSDEFKNLPTEMQDFLKSQNGMLWNYAELLTHHAAYLCLQGASQ